MESAVVGPPEGVPAYRLLALLEPARPRRVVASTRATALVVATVCVGAFMGQLDASIVSVALPRLSVGLHTGLGAVEWVSLSYIVTLVALVAPVGAWADAVGRKSLYLGGFAVFTAASAGCAVAPDLAALCALRALQAVGAALMQANSVALITSVVPAERLGRAVGVQAAAQAIGLAAGPLVGGALLAAGSWRLLFLVNVPAGVIGIVTGALLLPRSRDLAPLRRFDVPGLSRFIPAVGLTLLALSLVAGRGDLRWVAAPATAGSVVLAVSFARQQRRAPHPLLDRALMQRGQFRRGLSAALAGYAALFGMLVMVPVLLTGAGLESAGRVGLELAALPVAIGVVAPLAGRWADRRPLAVARIGMAVAVLALASVAAYRPTGPALAVALGGLGVGLGCFTPANNRALMLSAVGGPIGAASGLLNMSRGIGTAVGTAVVTVSVTAVAGAGPHFSQSAARAGLAVGGTVLAGICLGGLALLRRR